MDIGGDMQGAEPTQAVELELFVGSGRVWKRTEIDVSATQPDTLMTLEEKEADSGAQVMEINGMQSSWLCDGTNGFASFGE